MVPIVRWGPAAAVAGGLLWLLVWAHAQAAHGPTQTNRKDVVLGLTWMDSGKVLPVCFVLFAASAVALARRLDGPGRLGPTGLAVTLAGLGLLAVGAALQFWRFPWGTYANEAALFDSDVVRWGGAVQASGTVVVTAGLLLLAVALARRRPPGWASGLLLVPSGPASFFLTPVLPVTGLAWLAAGIALHLTGRPLTAVVSNR